MALFDSSEYQEIPVFGAAKRCGVQWAPWMGDWFTSWSPRNSNSHAEGTWDHWVDLAICVLQDPMTQLVRPEAHAVAEQLKRCGFYDESNRELTEDELKARFKPKEDAAPDASASHPMPVGEETAAKPTNHAYTSHGWPCCDQTTGKQPDVRARCGTVGICDQCQEDADRIHASA